MSNGLDSLRDALLEECRDRHVVDADPTRQWGEPGLVALITEAFLDGALLPPAAPALLDDLALALTCRALAMAGVEGEEPRIELRVPSAAAWACSLARELHLVSAGNRPGGPVAHLQGFLEQLQQLCALRGDTAHDELHVVLGVAVKLHPGLQRLKLAVDACLGEAVFHGLLEELAVNALSPAHNGREERHFLSAKPALHVVDELARRSGCDRDLAIDAMQDANTSPD